MTQEMTVSSLCVTVTKLYNHLGTHKSQMNNQQSCEATTNFISAVQRTESVDELLSCPDSPGRDYRRRVFIFVATLYSCETSVDDS